MKAQWKEWSAKFAALQPREKYLVCGAVLAVILLGGQSLWVGPADVRLAVLRKQVMQDKTDIANLGPQVDVLRAKLTDPEAGTRKVLADTKAQLASIDTQLKDFDRLLVAPDRMSQLLQSVLLRHRGLQLVSLRTLPPVPAIQRAEAGDKPTGSDKAKPLDEANIYKHGIEIKVAGGYNDLMAYLAEMEQSRQRLLMGKMAWSVTKYPRVELTLTVYSLSLDKTWLVV